MQPLGSHILARSTGSTGISWQQETMVEESAALAACSRQERVHFTLGKSILDDSQSVLEHIHRGSCMWLVLQAFVKRKSGRTNTSDEAAKLESWKRPLQRKSPTDCLSWVTKLWLFWDLGELCDWVACVTEAQICTFHSTEFSL